MSTHLPQFRTLEPYKDVVSAGEWNALTGAVARLCRSLGASAVFDGAGLHFRAAGRTHRPAYYKVQSNDGGGLYTLRPQVWDETTQAFTDRSEANDISGHEINGNAAVTAGVLVEVRLEMSLGGEWVGLFDFTARGILFGKPTGAFSSGATITLDPCDIHGTDTGEANRTVYVQADQSSYSMTNSTTIPTSAVVAHCLDSDGNYYMLGTPVEVMTGFYVDTTDLKLQKKTRNVWVLTTGSEAASWVDIHTGDACPV